MMKTRNKCTDRQVSEKIECWTDSNKIKSRWSRRGSGYKVSVLAIHSNHPSLNPTDVPVLLNKSKQRNKYRDEQKYTNRLCLTKTAAMCGKIGRWIEVKEINTLSLQIDFIVSTFAIKSIKFRLFRNYPKTDPWAQKMNKHSLKCSKTESHVIQITSFTFFG